MIAHRRWGWWLFIAACAVVAVCGCWWVYNRYFSERANPSLEEYPVRGIDISAHNGEIDFSLLAGAGVDFAYIKATEGTDFIDRNYLRNALGLERAGIPAGAYHFFRFDTDGEMQAWNFLHAIRGRRFMLPPAIDLEEWSNPEGYSTRQIMTELKAMLAILRAEGITPVIYTNKDGYNRFVKDNLDGYPLWICSFTDPPLPSDVPWHIWQFSHRGTLPGISGYVDLNTVNPGSIHTSVCSALETPFMVSCN